jgi:hypothetical protein
MHRPGREGVDACQKEAGLVKVVIGTIGLDVGGLSPPTHP